MKTRNYTFTSPKLQKQYKIAVLSDFHNSKFERILQSLDTDIDYIVMPGDFCVRYTGGKRHRVVPFLQHLSKIAPVYCSLGNHDVVSMQRQEFYDMVKNGGATPLLDEFIVLNDLQIAGWYNYKQKASFPPQDLYAEEKFCILLSHKPEWYFSHLQQTDFDLIISGHAHGGQVRLFGQGILAPGQGLFPKYVQGIYDNRLLVSAGIGNPVCLPRFGNPKEILYVHLLPTTK